MSSLADKIIAENYLRAQALSWLAEERSRREEEIFGKKTEMAADVDVSEGFNQAQKEIEAVPELIIYSALPVSDEIISDLGRKTRELFGKPLFIDVKIDPDLIGSAALAWKGQYKDYSLRARFEEKKDILKGIYGQFSKDRGDRIRPKC